jgi:O-antigen/teichoic acid export membrane protein
MSDDARGPHDTNAEAGSDPDVELERSDGLHAERTELAWNRSGLALVGALAILARRVWSGGVVSDDYLVVALLAGATLAWAVGILGVGLFHHRSDEPRPRSAGELLAVALGTVAIALAGILVTLANG